MGVMVSALGALVLLVVMVFGAKSLINHLSSNCSKGGNSDDV